jgi:hypothetical protein
VYLTAENGDALPEPKAGQYLTLRASGAPARVRTGSASSANRRASSVPTCSHGCSPVRPSKSPPRAASSCSPTTPTRCC